MAEKESTRDQVLSLGSAALVSQIVGVMVPVAMVRILDVDAFGQYRLLWLVSGTALLVGSLGLPSSLHYFLPRVAQKEKHRFVNQTILIMAAISLLMALITGAWNPLLPDNVRQISEAAFTVPVFVFLWVISSIIDVLPNADQRYRWQARSIVAVSMFRAITLVGVGALTKDLDAVFAAMIAVALFKLVLLFIYTLRYHGFHARSVTCQSVKQQVGYAVPTGIAANMFQLRQLGEQWVVASLFGPATFGVFAVATMVIPLLGVIRRPILSVILPKMNEAHGEQNIVVVSRLNRQGNVAVSLILLPLIALLTIVALPLMSFLFGSEYRTAAPIFMVYLIGTIPHCLEVSSLLLAFSQTRFICRLSVVLTVAAIGISFIGANLVGPIGAAFGSVFALFIGTVVQIWHVKKITGVPLRKLQDWSKLGSIVFSVGVAATVTLLGLNVLDDQRSEWFSLILAGTIFTFTYLGMLMLMGFSWMFQLILGHGQWVDN